MDHSEIRLEMLAGEYSIYRFPAATPMPGIDSGGWVSITRTADELSVVASQSWKPDSLGVTADRVETGYRCLRVVGTLEFSLVGILASLTGRMARANVPVFVISTYDTDYLLFPADREADARGCLGLTTDEKPGEIPPGRA